MPDRHGWNSWDQYQNVHQSCLNDYLDHFILDDGLTTVETGDLVFWEGVLRCADGIEIHVTKTLEVRYRNGQPEVRTVDYSYHVLHRREDGARNLFRYDNAHPHPHRGTYQRMLKNRCQIPAASQQPYHTVH